MPKPEGELKEKVRPVTATAKRSTPIEVTALERGKLDDTQAVEVALVPAAAPVETRYELRFAVRKETFKALEEAKVILSSRYPRGLS